MVVSRLKMSALALVLSAWACGSPNEPEVNAIVEVKAQSIVPTFVTALNDTWMSFNVPVTVRNLGKSEILYDYCATIIEVGGDSGWETAWSPICAVADGDNAIAVGSSRDFDIPVAAGVSGRGGPEWGGHPGARYRVAVALIVPGKPTIPRVASGVFSLVGE